MFCRLLPTSPATLLLLLIILAVTAPQALAQDELDESDEPTVEVIEDEEVEDIEDSIPRRHEVKPTLEKHRATDTTSLEKPSTKKTVQKPARQQKPLKIAPNINLKEVAPPPEPEMPRTAEVEEPIAVEEPTPVPEPVAASISLFGTEILPGTSTRLSWSPGIQIASLSQPTPILVVNGVHPGPALCLVGAIHGDELNGIEIIRRVLYDLNPQELSGQVIGIPIVNLQGFQQGSRYLPDRRDLNRHFPGRARGHLADRFAHALFDGAIRHCDMLVDIHTGSFRRTNLPQLRADMNIPEVADFTRGFDRIAVVHSSGAPGMLRNAAVNIGITAVTMEAGESSRIQEHQIKAGVNSIHSLMEKYNMISRLFSWGDPEPVYYDTYWIRTEYGGILSNRISLGDRVFKGQLLGIVTDPITNARHRIKAQDSGRVIGMAVDQVVMSGFAAYHIGAEAKIPERN
ncbi:succinylglutamate desuccinylase/aspartoacylase family protein [Porticoccus sp.]